MTPKEKVKMQQANDKKIELAYRKLLKTYQNIETYHEMYMINTLPHKEVFGNHLMRLTKKFKELRNHQTLQNRDIVSGLEPILIRMNSHIDRYN